MGSGGKILQAAQQDVVLRNIDSFIEKSDRHQATKWLEESGGSGHQRNRLEATAIRSPIPGTVLPTTGAICLTWAINSSNWSG